MKKKILVLQFRTDESLKHERECIIKMGDLKKSDLHFLNVLNLKTKLPKVKNLAKYKGIMLGGSGQINISSWIKREKTRIKRIWPLLKAIIQNDLPMLNICFGHQLIAYFLNGDVKDNPRQAETGTYDILPALKSGVSLQRRMTYQRSIHLRSKLRSVLECCYKIHLNETAKNCPLFKNIPDSFYAVLGHKDSVTNLPKGAKLLAFSDRCGIESYRIKNNIYSVQFHPEIDKNEVKTRLNLYPSYAKGGNVEKILKEYKETPFAKKIIINFKHICDTVSN